MKARKHGGRVRPGWLLVLALAALTLSSSAVAQRRAGPPQSRGDISRFHQRDGHAWHGGHWRHARHDARVGVWLGFGGPWYSYPAPLYPYPYPYVYTYPYAYAWEPPLALASPPAVPPTQYWYFCEATRTCYPYVRTCPGGWQPVPAIPSDASPVPQQ